MDRFTHGHSDLVVILLCIVNLIILTNALPAQTTRRLSMCNMHYNMNKDGEIICNVSSGQLLDYRDIRMLSGKELKGKYSVKIKCNGGVVNLPWPFKARNIISLEVINCTVLGFLSEMTIQHNIEDELKILELSDISVEIAFQEMIKLRSLEVPRSTDCGQLTLSKLVLRNLHYDLKMTPEERDGMRQIVYNTSNLDHNVEKETCVYDHLKYIDESGSRKSRQYHLKLIPEHARFPVLEMYNMSGNEMSHVPLSFKQLHSSKFPALRLLDFSNNFLRGFEFDLPKDHQTCSVEIVDLRNNQIQGISTETTQKLKTIGTIFVDLRQNPLRCTCRLLSFKEYLENQYLKTSDIDKRKRVSDITCTQTQGYVFQGKLIEVSLLNATFGQKCPR